MFVFVVLELGVTNVTDEIVWWTLKQVVICRRVNSNNNIRWEFFIYKYSLELLLIFDYFKEKNYNLN